MGLKLALFILTLPAFGQVTAIAKPVSIKNSNAMFGRGKDVGLWSIGMCSDYPNPIVVQRARLMMAMPTLRDVPNKQAADLLMRKAAKDVRSIVGNNGDAVLGLASTGAGLAGIASGSKGAGWVGLGIAGAQIVFRLLKSAEPSPAATITDLLPDQVPLAAGACADNFYVVASLTRNAATIGPILIQLPQLSDSKGQAK